MHCLSGKGATLIPTTASIQTSQPARRTLKIVTAPAGQSVNAPALPRTTTISIAPSQQSAKPMDASQRNQLEARLKEAQKAADAFNEAYRKQKEEAERLKKQLETLSGAE
jgi:ribosomal protein L7/L12